jgi:hypothetical protein
MASTDRDEDKDAQKSFDYASKHFRPLYFIRSYPSDKKKIEMSFDLCVVPLSNLIVFADSFAPCSTIYQAQFQGVSEYGPSGTGVPKSSSLPPSQAAFLPDKPSSSSAAPTAISVREPSKTDPDATPEPPLPKHVFQTIFLDKEDSEHLWSRGEIKEDEFILTKWWKQQSHRWQHCELSSIRSSLPPSSSLTLSRSVPSSALVPHPQTAELCRG